MMRFLQSKMFLTLFFFSLFGCIAKTYKKNISFSSFKQQKKVIDPNKSKGKLELFKLYSKEIKDPAKEGFADIQIILAALRAEENKNYTQASKLWFAALKKTPEELQRFCFQRWITNLVEQRKTYKSFSSLADYVLRTSQEGSLHEFMKQKKISKKKELVNYLIRANLKHRYSDLMHWVKLPSPPQTKGVPFKDPLLLQTVKPLCQQTHVLTKEIISKSWAKWVKSLDPASRIYWDALVNDCFNGEDKVLKWQSSIKKMRKIKRIKHEQVLYAQRKIAVYQRRLGQRRKVAESYNQLMQLWKKKAIGRRSKDEKTLNMVKEKVDDALWACRYNSLLADYSTATQHAKLALQELSKQEPFSKGFAEDLKFLKMEAYFCLAHRISLEKKNYQEARRHLTKALQIEVEDKKAKNFQNMIAWYHGFYFFLARQQREAIKVWQNLLLKEVGPALKERSYFWLAYTFAKEDKQTDKTVYLKKLNDEFPLSYYNLVAGVEANIQSPQLWQEKFSNLNRLQTKLFTQQTLEITSLRSDPRFSVSLERAEFFLLLSEFSLAKKTLNKLYRKMQRKLDIENDLNAFLYLSHLYYIAGSYSQSISIITALAREKPSFWQKYPEEIFIYFPKPYAEIFAKQGANNQVPESLLFALTRQESAFQSQAISYVGAKGLMQLMPHTSKRFLGLKRKENNALLTDLNDPQINIALGSRYLQFLAKRYKRNPAAAIAAYNAGEDTVDIWLKRRKQTELLTWLELIPFGETRNYTQRVLRNQKIYQMLLQKKAFISDFKTSFIEKLLLQKRLVTKKIRLSSQD